MQRHLPSAHARFLAAVWISSYGDWLATVAIMTLLLGTTGSTAALAGYVLVFSAPRLVGPIVGGRLADRIAPHRALVLCAAVQTVISLCTALAVGVPAIAAIYPLVFLNKFLSAASRSTHAPIIAAITPEDRLTKVNGLYSAGLQSSLFAAPALGSGLLAITSPTSLMVIDALTFLVTMLLVSSLPIARAEYTASQPRFSWRQLVGSTPITRLLACAYAAEAITAAVVLTVLTPIAADRLHSASDVGILYAAVGAGGIVGGLVVSRWRIPADRPARIAGLLSVYVIGVALLGPCDSVLLTLLLLAVSNVADGIGFAHATTLLQRSVPRARLGAEMGAFFTGANAGMVAGALLGVAAGSVLPWTSLLMVAGCVSLILLLVVGWLARGLPEHAAMQP